MASVRRHALARSPHSRHRSPKIRAGAEAVPPRLDRRRPHQGRRACRADGAGARPERLLRQCCTAPTVQEGRSVLPGSDDCAADPTFPQGTVEASGRQGGPDRRPDPNDRALRWDRDWPVERKDEADLGRSSECDGPCRRRMADRLRGHDETIAQRLERDLAAFQRPLAPAYDACEKVATRVLVSVAGSLPAQRLLGPDDVRSSRRACSRVCARGGDLMRRGK